VVGPLNVILADIEEGEAAALAGRIAEAGGHATFRASPLPMADERADILIFSPRSIRQDLAGRLKAWCRHCPKARLIVLLEAHEAESIPTLFEHGALAFLPPDVEVAALRASFAALATQGVYIARPLLEQLFMQTNRSVAAIGLTLREQQILRLIAFGMSNKDIARKLDLSVRTVETHRLNIRKKTSASNRRDLASIAQKLGLMGEDYGFNPALARRPAGPGFHEE
jgi:DNA-binding NarL/FixJ family response regulator